MFKKVTRQKNKLLLALEGPSKSGKTYTALRFAFAIAARDNLRVCVIDTENGKSALYAGSEVDGLRWEWDGVELEHFAPQSYAEAIREAGRQGYGVLIIDSLSHAWFGKGGALEQVDKARAKAGGAFGGWKDVTPAHNDLIDSILRFPGHLIATMRQKHEYVVEQDERGKAKVQKVGTKPVQREGMEYEFDHNGTMDLEHTLEITGSRCPLIDGKKIPLPTGSFILPVVDWLAQGIEPPARVSEEVVSEIKRLAGETGTEPAALKAIVGKLGHRKLGDLSPEQGAELLTRLQAKKRKLALSTKDEGGAKQAEDYAKLQKEAEEVF